MNDASPFALLAHLWLHEPDEASLAQARTVPALAAALRAADTPATLAAAYADLFLLNVYPYGTAYTHEYGDLNTAEAQQIADLFAAHNYAPRELSQVGAPDHLGLCLGFLHHLSSSSSPLSPLPLGERGKGVRGNFLANLLAWAPICCFAAEREPSAHAFYRALAQLTREQLMSHGLFVIEPHPPLVPDDQSPTTDNQPAPMANDELPITSAEEVHLRDIIRFLLAPARSGLFLSRARFGQMARALGMKLPFGSRFEVAEWLFISAGENDLLSPLLTLLRAEIAAWETAYRTWAAHGPLWQPFATHWLERLAATQRLFSEMEQIARHAPGRQGE